MLTVGYVTPLNPFFEARRTDLSPQTSCEFVIFTDDATKRYEDFAPSDLCHTDETIGIKYDKAEIVEDSHFLLHYNCPQTECDHQSLGWPDLQRHVSSVHRMRMCDLCTRNKKVFTHEHDLFTAKSLESHMRYGDDNPGAVDQTGFKGHPMCGFCNRRFYGEDELFVHCRERHERCRFCDADDPRRPHYYPGLPELEEHFSKDHFMCMDPACRDKHHENAFGTEMDLKAHQLSEHGNTLSKDVRRDARMVDLSGFNVRERYQEPRRGGAGGGREGRGRGRGRDPNAEPIPASSAQPMRRDEQAFQRQMAVHSAQSISTRTFGGQLSAPTPAPATASSSRAQAVPRPAARQAEQTSALTNSLAELELNAANLTPQERARRLRHAAVLERASNLLGQDATKLTQFRNAISTYRQSSSPNAASSLIDAFFGLFDTSSANLGTLVREVADLYEDKTKADALRTAWNDWRAINEDYPSLPMASSVSGGQGGLRLGWATVTSAAGPSQASSQQAAKKSTNRVLKLKSSTAQSSRSQGARNGSWGGSSSTASSVVGGSSSSRAPQNVATPNDAFPDLPGIPSSSAPSSRPSAINTIPWSASAAASASSSARPTPPPSRPVSVRPAASRRAGGADAFPALPPAPKPQSTIFGYGRGMVRRDLNFSNGGRPAPSAWNAGSAEAEEEAEAADGAEEAGKGKKGNKGKKKVLVHWG